PVIPIRKQCWQRFTAPKAWQPKPPRPAARRKCLNSAKFKQFLAPSFLFLVAITRPCNQPRCVGCAFTSAGYAVPHGRCLRRCAGQLEMRNLKLETALEK